MIDKAPPLRTPPERPDAPGMRGTYGQGDFVESARRDRWRRDQHFADKPPSSAQTSDPYGAGGFAAGGEGQSGYGADFGQLEPARRHEKQVSEHDLKKAGTAYKSNR